MSEPLEVFVQAIGSTDALAKAKQTARERGWRIRTVASIRPVGEVTQGQRGTWKVTLAVSRPSWAVLRDHPRDVALVVGVVQVTRDRDRWN